MDRICQLSCVLMVTLSQFVCPSAFSNLLQNPGFEQGSAQGGVPSYCWKYNNCGQESWAARSGTNGMSFWSWDNGGWGGFGQDVDVSLGVGDVLTFSIWGLTEENYQLSSKTA